MKINKKEEALLIVRYGAVGILNTLVTIATYFLLRRVGVGPDMANFLSYLAGILNSYVFNRLWVFRSRENRYLREGAVFFLGAALCWALQWVAFRLLLLCLSERAAYLIGMCVYPGLNYLYNRLVTFKRNKRV